MKKLKNLVLTGLVGVVTLAGCSTMNYDDTRKLVVEGEAVEVQVKDIKSFQIEIAPRKAVCQVTDTAGNHIDSECLQYRRTFDRNFINLSGDIQGFDYEVGNRYVLDVQQKAVINEQTGKIVPIWSLNKIISKTSEQLN